MSVHKDEKTGKWYYTGKYRDLAGKRHDYKKRGFRTKKEAKTAEDAFLLKIKGGQGRIKMNALIELYHQEMSNVVKKSTLDFYKMLERKHIKPYFDDKFIDTIKTIDITKWNKERALYGNNGGAYSDEYINHMYLHMSGLLTFAVNHKLLDDNPCKYGKPYKDPNKKIEEQNSVENFWEVDEYNRFIKTVENIDHKDAYETLFLTGLRIGELCALRWCDLDFKNKKLSVKGTFSPAAKTVTSPKTPVSIRTIDLPKRLNKTLEERYNRKCKLDGFTEYYYVFGDIVPTYPGTFRYRFRNDLKKTNIKYITIHGLRHSHASYLLSNPMISEGLIAERMGHSIEMLRKTYAHIYEKRRTALVEYIEDL